MKYDQQATDVLCATLARMAKEVHFSYVPDTPTRFLYSHAAPSSARRQGRILDQDKVLEAIGSLLARGADPNVLVDRSGEHDAYRYPIILFAGQGLDKVVDLLIHHGASVYVRGEQGNALMVAIRSGKGNVIKTTGVLLDNDADPNESHKYLKSYRTPLQLACEKCEYELIELLLDHDAIVDISNNGRTAVEFLMEHGHSWFDGKVTNGVRMYDKVIALADRMIAMLKPSKRPRVIGQALAGSIYMGNTPFVRHFLDKYRASANAWAPGAVAPLVALSAAGALGKWKEIVEMLISAGADVNGAASDGKTPLHKAIADKNIGLAQTLVDAGADVYARFGNGKRKYGLLDIIRDKDIDDKTRSFVRALLARERVIRARHSAVAARHGGNVFEGHLKSG